MVNATKDPTTKNNSSSISSSHPPYFQMVSEAITTMKDRTGSSQPAIAKFMEENYTKQLPPNFRKTLSVQLKRLIKSEKLVKVKNSYKINAAGDTAAKTAVQLEKKPPSKKGAAKITEKKSAKKVVEKAKRTKRLSQLRTPEALKKKPATLAKRKLGGKTSELYPPAKKAKK